MPRRRSRLSSVKRSRKKSSLNWRYVFTVLSIVGCSFILIRSLLFISAYLAQEKVDAAVLQDWEEHLYDDVFVVERVYDGPIDGWFYVEWGPVYQSDHREAARYVQCRCDPCVAPCVEDRVPEADLQRTAPLALAAYKSTTLYERRLQEYELAAILRSTA